MSSPLPQLRDDEATARFALAVTLIVFSTSILLARVHVKWRILRSIGPDDVACIAAMLCAIEVAVLQCYVAHILKDSDESKRIEQFLKSEYACSIGFNLAIFFVKLSLLLQYLRIFPTKKTRVALWITLAIIIIYGAWSVLTMVFICWPIRAFWDFSFAGQGCLDFQKVWVANASLNMATDILIIALPIPGLKRLMLPLSQRLGLMMVFTIGGCVCVVAMLRLAAALHATNELDGHWGGISLGQWANIETNVAIICCCLPTLRPLAKRLSPYVTLGKGRKWFTRSKSSGKAGGLVETISDGSSNEKVSQSLSKETGAVIVSELSSSSSGLKESNV